MCPGMTETSHVRPKGSRRRTYKGGICLARLLAFEAHSMTWCRCEVASSVSEGVAWDAHGLKPCMIREGTTSRRPGRIEASCVTGYSVAGADDVRHWFCKYMRSFNLCAAGWAWLTAYPAAAANLMESHVVFYAVLFQLLTSFFSSLFVA